MKCFNSHIAVSIGSETFAFQLLRQMKVQEIEAGRRSARCACAIAMALCECRALRVTEHTCAACAISLAQTRELVPNPLRQRKQQPGCWKKKKNLARFKTLFFRPPSLLLLPSSPFLFRKLFLLFAGLTTDTCKTSHRKNPRFCTCVCTSASFSLSCVGARYRLRPLVLRTSQPTTQP